MTLGRKTGGRQKGTLNRATVERQLRAASGIEAAMNHGLLPLDVMLARMRDEPLPNGQRVTDDQLAAAIAAAPYIHPRLATAPKEPPTIEHKRPSLAELLGLPALPKPDIGQVKDDLWLGPPES